MSLGAMNNLTTASPTVSSTSANAGVASGTPKDKDRAESQTAPQFGEVLKDIQAKYGVKPEKGREIKKTLGKDDFLRIMITQMRHQDPTNPFKAEQMAAEMAQFTSVEQLQNMNQTLTKMTTANQPLERMAMTGMIGKTVTVDKSRFPHTEGTNDTLTFGLPRDAAQVSVSIVNENGETIMQKDMGKLKAGEGSFVWDGLKANTLPSKSGNFMLRVDAVDERAQRIETNPQSQARVIGVSFEGSEPVFLIGDAHRQEKITMKNIVRIDSNGDGALMSAPQGGAVPAGTAGASSIAPNFISFKKGQGSSNLDATQIPLEAQQALARYQGVQNPQAPVAAANPAAGAVPEEKGFPNGLHDDDNQKGGNSK